MIVTCDPGVDDLLALLVLVGAGVVPDAVVATSGNVDVPTAVGNTEAILGRLGLTVPVVTGPPTSIAGAVVEVPGEPFHGPDGLGGVRAELGAGDSAHTLGWEAGMELLQGAAIVTGPLTAVALARRAGAGLTRITWMGGSVSEGGNITPAAEFNAWLDPEAADEVLTGDVPVAMVPLDATHRLPLYGDDIEAIGALGAAGALAANACRQLVERDGVVYPHDGIAVAAALHPEWFSWEQLEVRCETAGRVTVGETVADRRPGAAGGPVEVAMDLDVPAVHDFLLAGLAALERDGGRQPG